MGGVVVSSRELGGGRGRGEGGGGVWKRVSMVVFTLCL